ncbi:MAG TPA: pentapeptide repeat-containing protein [Syntrophorhabdaceae bacterium]
MTKIVVPVFMALVTLILLFPCLARAFNQAHLDQMRATQNCRACDLSGASLTGASLAGSDLSGSDLSNSDLSGANLSGANLSGASLSQANLSAANLTGANLSGTRFTGAIWPDGSRCEAGSVGECVR